MYQRTSHLPLPATRSTLTKQRRHAVEKPSLLILVLAVFLLAIVPAGVSSAADPDMSGGPWDIGICEADGSNVQYSFVVITDLHVGQGLRDYGDPGWNDYAPGDPIPLATGVGASRLAAVLDWIESNKDALFVNGLKTNGFRFVVELGDLTDSGELSEMAVAKNLLDTRLTIPWVPAMGNHEIWPFACPGTPCSLLFPGNVSEAPHQSGVDQHAYNFYKQQVELLDQEPGFTVFPVAPPQTVPGSNPSYSRYFFNYAFEYTAEGSSPLHFVALDFSARDRAPLWGVGVPGEGDLHTNYSSGPYNWFANHLADNGDTTVILTHHTLELDLGQQFSYGEVDALEDLLIDNWQYRYFGGWFSGHGHVFKERRVADPADGRTAIWVVETEANVEQSDGALRIVRVCMNTSIGDDSEVVSLSPFAEGSSDQPVTLHFPNVRWIGTTSLNVTSTGPAPPPGYWAGWPRRYFELETTAMHWDPVGVEVEYGDINFPLYPDAVELFHWDGTSWHQITDEVHPDLGVITGTIPDQSPRQTLPSTLAIFEPMPGGVWGYVLGNEPDGAAIELLDADEIIARTDADTTGLYSFGLLREGSYQVRVKEPFGYTVADNPRTVAVPWATDVPVHFILDTADQIDHTMEYRQGFLPTRNYFGATDAWINQNSIYNNYGTDDHLKADGVPIKKILFKWDLGDLPTDLRVISSTVTYMAHNSTSGPAFQGYRLGKDWKEREVTWLDSDVWTSWEISGAQGPTDRDSDTIGGFTTDGKGYQGMVMNDVGTAMIESWIQGLSTNYGFIIEGPSSDGIGLDACDHHDVTKRPTLKVSVIGPAVKVASFQQGALPDASYAGYADSWIKAAEPGENYGSDVKLDMDGLTRRKTLMRWDVTSLPQDITVTGVRIRYHVVNRSHEKQYGLYEMKRPWSQYTVTWDEAVYGTPWETAGADGASDRDSVELGRVVGVAMGFEEIELNDKGVAVVQSWVDGVSVNNGLIALGSADDGVDIDSGESSDVEKRPMLIVTYVVNP